MPKINHRKAKTGCQRCKTRKVKCDETKPKCSACVRHAVDCIYMRARTTGQQPSPPSSDAGPHGVVQQASDALHLDPLLELRLVHEWTAHVCQSFSSAWEYWRYQLPLRAVEYNYVMDAMLAISALHASKMGPKQWLPLEGRMVSLRDGDTPIDQGLTPDSIPGWKVIRNDPNRATMVARSDSSGYLSGNRHPDMLRVSRIYFDRSVERHRKALGELSIDNIEGVYVTSILISLVALFQLDEGDEEEFPPMSGAIQWMRLARASRDIVRCWYELVGDDWIKASGVFYGKPDLSDEEELFRREHAAPFTDLLDFGLDFEKVMTEEDRDAYQKSLSYIGLIYKGIVEGLDDPLVTSRRFFAMPSRLPPRFNDLVEQEQPRALVMLAHAFACMKLIAEQVPWFRGIAERQIPVLQIGVPTAWKLMMQWPMEVASGMTTRIPHEIMGENNAFISM